MSAAHRYCSLGDDRSWTDIVTNVTQLSAARVEEDFDALMGWGSVPRALLPGFLHELTHHWCFLSPVGFTLAMLQMRARRSGVLLINGMGDAAELSQRLLADVSRYETVAAMLRPLAEGLALFAEFDAISGRDSAVLSLPSELTGVFYGIRDVFDTTSPVKFMFESHRAPMMEMRGGYQCFRRKRALLQQPLDPAAGGYLPGYLTVRALWRHLAEADPRLLNETDLLLMYLRSFFYDDPGLVQLMLRPWTGSDDHFAIVKHIADRFDALAGVQARDLRAYESAILARGDERGPAVGLADAILVDSAVAAAGEQLSQAMIAELETVDLESVEGALRLWDRELLGSRDIMYLGSVNVDVDVLAERTCVVTTAGGVSRRLTADDGAVPGRGAGRIDIFFSTLMAQKARAAVVYRGRDRVATSLGGPDALTDASRERFATLTTSRASIQAGTEEMGETMDKAIAGGALDAEEIADMRRLAADATAGIYHNMSTLGMAAEDKERAIARMAHDGFLEVLGWDDALVDGLAMISLAWPRRQRRDDIARALAEQGADLTDLLAQLDERSRDHGSTLVLATSDLLLAAV